MPARPAPRASPAALGAAAKMMEEIDRFQVPAVRAEMQPLVRGGRAGPRCARVEMTPVPWGSRTRPRVSALRARRCRCYITGCPGRCRRRHPPRARGRCCVIPGHLLSCFSPRLVLFSSSSFSSPGVSPSAVGSRSGRGRAGGSAPAAMETSLLPEHPEVFSRRRAREWPGALGSPAGGAEDGWALNWLSTR